MFYMAGCLKIVFHTCWTMIILRILHLISLWRIWSDRHLPRVVFWIKTTYNCNKKLLSGYYNHILIIYRELFLMNVQSEKFLFIFRPLPINSSCQVLFNLLSLKLWRHIAWVNGDNHAEKQISCLPDNMSQMSTFQKF